MLCLNLGSFVDVIPGDHWVNIDIIPIHQLDIQFTGTTRFLEHDLRTGLKMYDDNSVTAIRASHVFEHLLIEEQRALAKECYRVLEHGGVMRVMVPDGFKVMMAFANNRLDMFDHIQPDEYINAPTQFEKFSRLLYSGDGAHHCLHDREFLQEILQTAGFKNGGIRPPNASSSNILQNETRDQHIEISLIMEAIK